MSDAIQCDQCGATLVVNRHREDEDGESAAWLRLTIGGVDADLCTRSCLHDFIEREDVVAAHDAQYEVIADIARSICEARDEEADQ